MKFSILIAHYNNWNYFQDCYQSIQKQDYKDFEIVIVDDFSTDGSFEKLEGLTKSDSRIKLFQNPENKGVGYTKRMCIEKAQGEICGFVDPDDALMPGALERSVKCYENEKISATHSEFYLCNSQLEILKKFPNTKKIRRGNPLFLNINFEINHFFTFKRTAYEQTSGIDPEITSAVDQDLYLKMYETGDLHYIQHPLYLYRLHEKGVSQEKSKKEKLNSNWDKVLRNALRRRGIKELYGKKVNEITLLQKTLIEKENSFLKRLLKRFKW